MRKDFIQAINDRVNMQDFLQLADVEISRNGMLYCPFHPNENTKAAKYFSDSNKVWCYAEQKMYGTYDVLNKLLQWDDAKIIAMLPPDVFKDLEFSTEKVKIPVVDEVTLEDFKDTGDIFEYLKWMGKYWQIKDKLICEEI